MKRLLAGLAVALSLGVSGCDYLPDYARAFFDKKTLPQNVSAGTFKAQVKVLFVDPKTPTDRDVQLIEPFGYKDSKGVDWDVPAGYVSDGASIPWSLWSFVGGPYDGPYRDAAILHDYFCEKKDRKWEDVHAMFLEAALKRGVSESTAQTMYAGILYGGPRWPEPKPVSKAQIIPVQTTPTTRVDPGITNRTATKTEQQIFDELRKWIEQTKPTPDQIKAKVEELRKSQGIAPATK